MNCILIRNLVFHFIDTYYLFRLKSMANNLPAVSRESKDESEMHSNKVRVIYIVGHCKGGSMTII